MPPFSWESRADVAALVISGGAAHLLSVHMRAARRAGFGRRPNGPFERTFRVLDVFERYLRGTLTPEAARIFEDWVEEARPAAMRRLMRPRAR